MDLVTGLIGLSIFLVCALAMFGLAFYSTKEKTFDDILKEQNKKWKKESKPQKEKKTVKPIQVKPKPKKKDKTSDDNKAQVSVKPPRKHVHEEEVHEIPVATVDAVKTTKEPTHIEKQPKVFAEIKPEIKESKKTESVEKPVVAKIVTKEQSPVHKPKQSKETKKSVEEDVKKKSKKDEEKYIERPVKDGKIKVKDAVKEKPIVLSEVVEVESSRIQLELQALMDESSPSPSPTPSPQVRDTPPPQPPNQPKPPQQRKKKLTPETPQHAPSGATAILNTSSSKELTDTLTNLPLDHCELQELIDVLLNKQQNEQHSDSEWIASSGPKVDSVGSLKKELMEKENQLTEEKSNLQNTSARLKEMRENYNKEKATSSQLEATYRETVNKKQQEVAALQSHLNRQHEQYQQDTAQLQAKIQQMQSSLSEENSQLKVQVEQLAGAAGEYSQLKVDAEELMQRDVTNQQANTNLQQTIHRLEEHVNTLHNSNEQQKQKEVLLQEEIEQLKCDLADAATKPDTQGVEVDDATAAELCSKTAELATCRSEIDSLTSQLREIQDQATRKEQELLQSHENGSSDSKDDAVTKIHEELNNYKQKLDAKEMCVSKYQQEAENYQSKCKDQENNLHSLQAQIQELQNRFVEDKERSTLLQQKLDKSQSQQNDLKDKLAEQQQRYHQLNSQMDSKGSDSQEVRNKLNTALTDLEEKKSVAGKLEEKLDASHQEVKNLKDEIELQRKKNNDLLNAAKCEDNKKTKEALAHLFPDANIGDLEYDAWLCRFSEEVQRVLNNMTCNSGSQDKLNSELSLVQEQLHQQINHCKAKEDEVDKLKYELKNETKKFDEASEQVSHYKQTASQQEQQISGLNEQLRQASSDDQTQQYKAAIAKKEEEYSRLSEELNNAKTESDKVSKEVGHYRQVLAQTENMLQNLQTSVDEAERGWREQLHVMQSQNENLAKQNTTLMTSVEEIRTAQEAAAEMQEKLVELQKKLEGETEMNKGLTLKYDKVEKSAEELQSQLEAMNRQLERTKQLEEEVRVLRDELTNEQSSKQQLYEEKCHVTSQLEAGEAALKEERERVTQLTDQIALHKSVGAGINPAVSNGVSNGSGGDHASSEDME